MKIGYARISTREQVESLETQEKTLLASGCERVYKDIASGAKASRPGLHDALSYAREDDIILVTRLDRLGRTTLDTLRTIQELNLKKIRVQALDINLDTSTPAGRLVLKVIASLAEWERDLLIERTKEGLAHARANNRVGRRPPKLDTAQKEAALNLLAGGMSQNQVAAAFGVSRPTIARLKSAAANPSEQLHKD